MSREIVTLVVPLLLPTVLYFAWLSLLRWTEHRSGPIAWYRLPWAWLSLIGVALTALVLLIVTVGFGTETHGTYIPPRAEDGHIVPGHIVPGKP